MSHTNSFECLCTLLKAPKDARRPLQVAQLFFRLGISLLQEGFTVEEIDYTITWLITHHPTTGAFSRLPHFIDQALKARDLQRQTPQHYVPDTREIKNDQ